MEEQILKIIELNYDSETGIISSPKASKEIAEHLKQFNLWCIKDVAMHFTGDFVACESNSRFKTQEELYSFWENEINK